MTQQHTSIDSRSAAQTQEAISDAARSADSRWPLASISDRFLFEMEHGYLDLTDAGDEALDLIEERVGKSLDLGTLAGLERVRRSISAILGRSIPMGTALAHLTEIYTTLSQGLPAQIERIDQGLPLPAHIRAITQRIYP